MKNKSLIIIIAHQDDEFCIFNRIYKFKNKKKIYVFYLTSGLTKILPKKKKNFRNIESTKVLIKLGVKENNIHFLGDNLSIKSNKLLNNLKQVYRELILNLQKIKGKKILYTHALEGGHLDHDCCYYLTRQARKNINEIQTIYQFPNYHSKNLPYILYRVLNPIKENGKVFRKKYDFNSRFKFIYFLFFYKSQLFTSMAWVGLYPFLIAHFLFSKSDRVQKINPKEIKIRRPHKGLLLYEKRGHLKYHIFASKISKFINSVN
tara:strand:+ start:2429 stop:3214 length:786 start_codon:yes stop_codon:yes gene_type:complete